MPPATASDEQRARRILIYGVTGSGKTTAAAAIASRLGLPCHLADELTWEPGWRPVPMPVQRGRFAAIAEGPAWVLDTAYGAWLDLVLPRADLVVGLDYPRWFSLQRLLRRTVARIVDGCSICNGNVETVRAALARDSILRWHFRSFARKRARMREWFAAGDGPPVLLFTRSADLDSWIRSLGSAAR